MERNNLQHEANAPFASVEGIEVPVQYEEEDKERNQRQPCNVAHAEILDCCLVECCEGDCKNDQKDEKRADLLRQLKIKIIGHESGLKNQLGPWNCPIKDIGPYHLSEIPSFEMLDLKVLIEQDSVLLLP